MPVWAVDLANLAEPPAAWGALLDGEERDRLERLRRAVDRVSYAAAHTLARLALARETGRPAAALAFLRPTGERPRLDGDSIAFSLSHAEGLAAVAVCPWGPVGVDVEAAGRSELSDPGVIRLSCSDSENRTLSELPPARRAELFLRLWTAKEAVAKAEGLGLALPFPSIRLNDDDDAAEISEPGQDPRRWSLWRCRPSPTHELALAWAGAGHIASRTLDAAQLTQWAEQA
mgnify:CR=1 FL=1